MGHAARPGRGPRFPETAKVWLPDGTPPGTGTTLRLPELASTLRLYMERGPDALTSGSVAAAVESASRAHGGVLTAADLASYRPVWRVTTGADGLRMFQPEGEVSL